MGQARKGLKRRGTRVPLGCCDRRGLDGAWLQPRGGARRHRAGRRAWACTRPRSCSSRSSRCSSSRPRSITSTRPIPDCGTTFSWCTRAFGPWVGWMAGWAVLAADIIVMANLADIAGLYSWILVGQDAPSKLAVMTVGVIWMVAMTVHRATSASRPRRGRSTGCSRWSSFTLALFAVVALYKVATMNISGELTPVARVVQPVQPLPERAGRPASSSASSSTGGGTRPSTSTRSRPIRRRAPARPRSSRRSCCSASTCSSAWRRRPTTASASSRPTATTCSRALGKDVFGLAAATSC